MSLRAEVVVASNRAAAGVYEDTTGPLIVDFLRELGFAVGDPVVVPDGEPVGAAIAAAAEGGTRVVLTTGGTGLTPTDRTPEVTRALLDREVPASPRRSGRTASRRASRPPSSPEAWREWSAAASWSTCQARGAV